MCLLGYRQVLGLCTSLRSFRLFFFISMQQYWCINFSNQHFPWAVDLNAITSILKHLHYSRGIGQAIFQVQDTSEKWVWQLGYVQSFRLKVFGLFQQIKNGIKHLHALDFKLCSIANLRQQLSIPNTAVTLIEWPHNTHCICSAIILKTNFKNEVGINKNNGFSHWAML